MSYQREREDFIARMTHEGLPLDVARLLLREATGLNRRAELACSSEAADRDRVPCPASQSFKPRRNGSSDNRHLCLCDHPNDEHETIPRITLQDHRAEVRILEALRNATDRLYPGRDWREEDLPTWGMRTDGDPRGYTLRVIPPSYTERNKGRDRFNLDTIGVPSGPSGLRF